MLYFISSACPALCDSIPMAVHDQDGNIEDVMKTTGMEDDILDGWRYGLKSMLSAGSKSKREEIQERLAAEPDYHKKSMMHRFLQKQLRPQQQGFSIRRSR